MVVIAARVGLEGGVRLSVLRRILRRVNRDDHDGVRLRCIDDREAIGQLVNDRRIRVTKDVVAARSDQQQRQSVIS
jgi:hypothetical protein